MINFLVAYLLDSAPDAQRVAALCVCVCVCVHQCSCGFAAISQAFVIADVYCDNRAELNDWRCDVSNLPGLIPTCFLNEAQSVRSAQSAGRGAPVVCG